LNGTGGGSVSGKLQLFTKTYIVEGEIRENGHFYFTIPRGEDDDLQLDVNFASEENTFEASLKAGEDEWSGISEINTLTDKRRDEVVGRYTIEFPAPGGDDSTFPQGNGYARIDVKPWGDVGIKGKLGDGTKFSTKGVLTGTGEDARVSMWVTPKQSRVSALFNFGEGLNPNISGPMRWYRNPSDSDFFPDGFYVPSLTTSGSRFTEQENNRSLSDAKKATLTLTAGNLSGTITQAIEITKSDKVIFLNSNPFGMEMSIDRDTGLFKGNFDHPFDDSRRKFQGALLQSQSKGSGVFLGIDRSGAVSISPGLPQAPVPTPTPTPPTTPTTPTNPNTPNIPNIPNIPGLNGDSIR
jgi:hypothetical protein